MKVSERLRRRCRELSGGVTDIKSCYNCEWAQVDDRFGDFLCANPASKWVGLFLPEALSCPCWEQEAGI